MTAVWLVMGDSITATNVPATVDVAAGYTGGRWPTYSSLAGLFPEKRLLAFAIAADQWGDALDIEPGDAGLNQVVGWVRNAWRPVNTDKPVLYINAARLQALVDTMTAAGYPRDSYYVLTAHYWGPEHVCGDGRCGFPQGGGTAKADGTQWYSDAAKDLSTIPAFVFGGEVDAMTDDDRVWVAAQLDALRKEIAADSRSLWAPGGEENSRALALVQVALQRLVPGMLDTEAAAHPATLTLDETGAEVVADRLAKALEAALAADLNAAATPPAS